MTAATTITVYEALSLLVASIALVVSLLALWSDIPLKRLQREQLKKEADEKERADIRLRLILLARGGRFVVENVGQGEAREVQLELSCRDGNSPLPDYELDRRFPADIGPGQRIEIIATPSLDSATVMDATINWTDQRGVRQQCSRVVYTERGS